MATYRGDDSSIKPPDPPGYRVLLFRPTYAGCYYLSNSGGKVISTEPHGGWGASRWLVEPVGAKKPRLTDLLTARGLNYETLCVRCKARAGSHMNLAPHTHPRGCPGFVFPEDKWDRELHYDNINERLETSLRLNQREGEMSQERKPLTIKTDAAIKVLEAEIARREAIRTAQDTQSNADRTEALSLLTQSELDRVLSYILRESGTLEVLRKRRIENPERPDEALHKLVRVYKLAEETTVEVFPTDDLYKHI